MPQHRPVPPAVPRRRRLRLTVGAAVLVAVGLTAAGCSTGGSSDAGTTTTSAPTASTTGPPMTSAVTTTTTVPTTTTAGAETTTTPTTPATTATTVPTGGGATPTGEKMDPNQVEAFVHTFTWDNAGEINHYTVEDLLSYDPDSTLSAVAATIERGTGSSPMRVFFFHDGVYVGTDWSTPRVALSLTDWTDDTVTVRYPHWAKGDGTADPSLPPWDVVFRWENGKVVPSQTVPENQFDQ